MKFHLTNRLLISISILAIASALAGAAGYWQSLSYRRPKLDKAAIYKVINEFRSSRPVLFNLKLTKEWRKQAQGELYWASTALPDPSRYDSQQMARALDLKRSCEKPSVPSKGDENIRKLQAWFDFKCGRRTEISPEIWRKPPLIHPLGGSWAYWLHSQGFGSVEWLVKERAFLHALEIRHLPESSLSDLEKIVADFSPTALEAFTSGAALVLSDRYLISTAFSSSDLDLVLVFPRADWENYTAGTPIQIAPAGTCEFKFDNFCWRVNPKFEKANTEPYLWMLAGSFLIMTAVVVMTLRRQIMTERAMEEKQRLVIQTLAHELRHPVQGLHLSAEVFRSKYDAFPDDLKTECLRLISLSQRMNRLVNTSQQYLKLMAKDRHFSFQSHAIPSINDFLESALERYSGKITVRRSTADSSATFDGYWVSTCLVNLVTNALTHGALPIDVSWEHRGRDLFIVISDGGSGPVQPLRQLIEPRIKVSGANGMGLGLSLVHRLLTMMNGKLMLDLQPTRFTISLREVCHDQTIAG